MGTGTAAAKLQTMSFDELSDVLGVSTPTLRRLAKEGRLPVPIIRIGRQHKFSRRVVEDLLSRQQEDGDREASAA